MILKDIISVSGESGLFRFIAQGKNSIIVEHLETKNRSSVFGSSKVNTLDDIAVFTQSEDMPLSQVFNIVFDKTAGQPVIDGKADNAMLKNWFEEILPQYDKERVYASDIRKIAQWYNTLQKLDLLVREEPEEKEETSLEEPIKEKPVKEKKQVEKKSKK